MSFCGVLSRELYRKRKALCWTQQDVADKVGISVRWYQQLEKGSHTPSALTMMRLVLVLDISVEVFRKPLGLQHPSQTENER